MIHYIKEFSMFLKHIVENKELILRLTKNDFQQQYLGSYLGLVWAFLQPMIFMLVIWFVFEIGFRTGPTTGETPFFLWLISGMVPWFFIANSLTSGTNSIVSKSFLVKKVAFRVSILPLIDICSSLIIHIVLLVFLIIAFLINGFMPTIYWIQLPFYILCTILLILGLSWLTSSIRIFVKDMSHLVAVILQLGFWATPIFWQISMIPEKYQWIVQLNPAFYIINGYRDTFINNIWFWENSSTTFVFLISSIVLFILGGVVFKKLRPHFGDVL